MFSIDLAAQDEYQWMGDNPSPATFPPEKGWYPLYHQWRTYNAEAPIIVNTYNTGTGKTKAGLLRLLKRAQMIGFEKLRSNQHNALLIAPTNELLAQHVDDARAFCKDNDLPYRVLALTKDDLDDCKDKPSFSEEQLRRGAVLHSILNDASKVDDDTSKRATLYVVNPDIFYYALLFCYSQFDRAALFTNFFTLFNYIIIDEFHYYDPKQLTAFLFFMKLSQHKGYLDSSAKKRQFCILTATPRPQVADYLKSLNIPIEWISPDNDIPPVDLPFVKKVRALAPVQLQIYNTEELQTSDAQGSLQSLAEQQQHVIRAWLDSGLDGAIISSSLGTVNRIHQSLKTLISSDEMGRITGAEKRVARSIAKKKALILATPTVDIGYNFERFKPQRQNIDFLLFDAYSGDEFIQRLGRAGRVLSKEEQDHKSIVLAAVDPSVSALLQKNDNGQTMERTELGCLAANEMPKRNDLYAYIKTGAILEIFRPITFIGAGTSVAGMPALEIFLQDIQSLFQVKRPFTYKEAQRKVRAFDDRKKHYGEITTIPSEAFEMLRLVLEHKHVQVPTSLERCVQALLNRIGDVQRQKKEIGKNSREVIEWVHQDLRCYFVDKARFSFRESFQPPLALLYDPEKLHSSESVALYNALHIAKYYEARFYATIEEWAQKTLAKVPLEVKDALAFCSLHRFRDTPLQIGLKLNANEHTQDEWEEQYAYQVTAFYGLEVFPLKDHHGLDSTLQALVSTQFVPTFAALCADTSATARELRKLQKRARFFPLQLDVTFCDGKIRTYLAVLGTMAFQVCAEIPYRAIAIDRRKTQLEDDAPFIC